MNISSTTAGEDLPWYTWLGVGIVCGFYAGTSFHMLRKSSVSTIVQAPKRISAPSSSVMKSLDPKTMRSPYNFLISAIVPRPIALVSTISEDGVVNVAPFSYFNVMCHDPPTLVFSVNNKAGNVEKDTLRNIRQNRQCVVNIISSWYLEQANITCGNFPREVSELKEANLAPLPSLSVLPPRVTEAGVQLECEVKDLYPLYKDGTPQEESSNIVICEISMIHVNENLYDEEKGTVILEKLSPISRLGGISYANVGRVTDIPRHSVTANK